MSCNKIKPGVVLPPCNPNIMMDAILEYNNICELQIESKIPTLSDILQTLSGLCHFMSSSPGPNKGKQGYWMETIGSECPLYLGHTKCQEKNKRGITKCVFLY